MIPAVDYRLKPEEKDLQEAHHREICNQLDRPLDSDIHFRVVRRNIDARGRQVWYVFRAEILEHDAPAEPIRRFDYQFVGDRPEVHIIGAGPCGYFAALQLLEAGLKPVVLERGKDVRARRRDLRNIQQFGLVDPDSNYCFGEGGAGTYSDGKLYTRADKRGDVKKVIEILIQHGANPEIRIDAHPHIGSNKLPDIIANIRETIRSHGGEVHFETRVEDFVFENSRLNRLVTQDREIAVQHCILATGHSARNIYETLYRREIELEGKPFALGVRVEHPQAVIDEIQYHQKQRDPNLPAASYSIACQVAERGVFSFCMCPGGLIIPAATAPGEIVVNGMSLSRRDSPFANSGLVTAVDARDFAEFKALGPLSGMHFQKQVEQKMFSLGDGSQKAPAQRLKDFIRHKPSADLPESSYIPGILPASLHQQLPPEISDRLIKGLKQFVDRMPLYGHTDAIVVATESRTSAPVKIPRDQVSLMHPKCAGLFPAGEGAGYAGGILSAAMDGQRVAQAIYRLVTGA